MNKTFTYLFVAVLIGSGVLVFNKATNSDTTVVHPSDQKPATDKHQTPPPPHS